MAQPVDLNPVVSARNIRVRKVAAAVKDGRCYWWEGVRFFDELVKENRVVRLLVVTDEFLRNRRRQVESTRVRELLVVTKHVFDRVAGTVESQGIGGLMDIDRHSAAELLPTARPFFYLAGLQDPGNVGAIVRIADAFSFGGVMYERRGASPYCEKAVRASAGSIIRVDTAESDNDCLNMFRKAGFRICLLSARSAGAEEISAIAGKGDSKFVLVLGREGSGLDFQAVDAHQVYIPMSGKTESLNVAVAAGIAAFCVTAGRRRR